MLLAASPALPHDTGFLPQFIAIRRDELGFGIRFGLTDAEDDVLKGPVFETLPEAFAWIDEIDRLRARRSRRCRAQAL